MCTNTYVDAIRAAAQAVTAITYGAELSKLSLDGIDICSVEARDADVLTDISVWVSGVAAVDRLRVGRTAGSDWKVDFSYENDQRWDLAAAAKLAEQADPLDEQDLLYSTWVWATDLMADETIWAAIETIARLIEMAAPPVEEAEYPTFKQA